MTLFVVATPLGNLEDVSQRAIRVLGQVDCVLAEDTRHSRRLLDAIGVRTRLVSYHDHSPDSAVERVLEQLRAGQSLALISDAGTPCISDPGYALIRAVQDAGFRVEPIPGPSALTTFLSAAGLPTDRFEFIGFFARKEAERRDEIARICVAQHTVVGYESPQRLLGWLQELSAAAPDREIAVGRELTKLHEEILRGSASEILKILQQRDAIRGEVVVGVGPAPAQRAGDDEVDAWLRELLPLGIRPRDLARVIARRLARSSDEVYARALALRGDS